MHLECDYTNCDSGKDLSTERTREEKDAGGIQICAEENLFDEIQIKDENIALLKLRQSMGKSGKSEF